LRKFVWVRTMQPHRFQRRSNFVLRVTFARVNNTGMVVLDAVEPICPCF
jgi:hypothetical protein